MKRFSITSLAIIATVLCITACGTKKENAQLLHQVDSLKTVLNNTQLMIESQNSELEENINCINDIQNALDAISQKENELRNLSSEQTGITDAQRRAQLKNDIEALGRQLEENKKKIDNLNYALSKSKKEVKGLNEMVAKLQQQVEQRDKDIADLRAVIDKKDSQISQLQQDVTTKTQQIKDLENTVSEQIASMNTAWYCIASKADLRNNGIIDKKSKIITKGDKYFTKIDKTQITEIPVDIVRKLIVLSAHPLSSYEIVYEKNKITKVKIKDANSFWSLGNRFVAISK